MSRCPFSRPKVLGLKSSVGVVVCPLLAAGHLGWLPGGMDGEQQERVRSHDAMMHAPDSPLLVRCRPRRGRPLPGRKSRGASLLGGAAAGAN